MFDKLRSAGLDATFIADDAWGRSASISTDRLTTTQLTLPLTAISAVFSRLGVGSTFLPKQAMPLVSWLNQAEETLVINRPWTQVSNTLKPFQYQAILRAGLAVPPTCILHHSALPAINKDHRLIAKSLGREQRPTEGTPADGEGDQQVQLRIEGDNIRVHVIGDKVLALHAQTSSLDYRFAALTGAPPVLTPFTLDAALSETCVRLTREMGLITAGIDLIIPQSGPIYCLEVNPNPGFTWFEDMSGQPITLELVSLIAAHAC